MSLPYSSLDSDVFPKVSAFKRSMITAATKASLKTTSFDVWNYEPSKVKARFGTQSDFAGEVINSIG
jgi:hypothetical protein